MEVLNGEFTVQIDNQNILLKIGMWILDENRFEEFQKKIPNSGLWQDCAIFYGAYCNACRSRKKDATLNPQTFLEWYENALSYDAENLASLTKILVDEVNKLVDNQKKIRALANQFHGQTSANTPLAS